MSDRLTRAQQRRLLARELHPLVSAHSEAAIKNDRPVTVHFLLGQDDFVPSEANAEADSEFEPIGPIPRKGRKRKIADGWRHAREVRRDGACTLVGNSLDRLVSVLCRVQQGSIGDCWVVLAIILLHRKQSSLEWIFSRNDDDEDHWTLLLKFNQKWTVVFLDKYLPLKDGELAFLKNVGAVFGGCSMEKGIAKGLPGFMDMDVGGLFIESMSMFSDGYGFTFLPSKMVLLALLELLHDCLEKEVLVSLGTKEKKSREHPYMVNGHVLGALKLYYVKIYNIWSVLVLLRDPHGVTINAPLRPGQPMWNLLDPDSQKLIAADLKERGTMVVPLEAIKAVCNIGEAYNCQLPPRPNEREVSFEWEEDIYHYKEKESSWNNVEGPASIEVTSAAGGRSRMVGVLTQIGRRFNPRKPYLHVRLQAISAATGEDITPPVGDNSAQVSLVFECEANTKVTFVPSALAFARAKGPFLLQTYNIEGVVAKAVVPPSHRAYNGNPALLLEWNVQVNLTNNELHGEEEAQSSCSTAHANMWCS